MKELNRLSISTLNWLFSHGDKTLKSAVKAALEARNKGDYQRVRR